MTYRIKCDGRRVEQRRKRERRYRKFRRRFGALLDWAQPRIADWAYRDNPFLQLKPGSYLIDQTIDLSE